MQNKSSKQKTVKKFLLAAALLAVLGVAYESLISKPLFSTSISLPPQSWSEIFGNSISRLIFWLASVGGKIRKTILPGVFTSGYRAVLRKSVSLVSKILFSVLARLKRWEFFTPLGLIITSWLESSSQRINRSLTFSSANNLTFKGNEFFSLGKLSGMPQGGRDMCASEGGKVREDLLYRFASRQHFQNLPNHNSATLESRFAMANFWISNDILINFYYFPHAI